MQQRKCFLILFDGSGHNIRIRVNHVGIPWTYSVGIPFYIYSARILQSYQGGQGILIRDRNTKDEVDAIRFTTPDEEHDVLYTMSSGQLSGILLSFSLSLHKIFANDGLNVLFIDDPVQCMDDLNIVSFVELMRTEFPNIQLLIIN